MDIRHLRLIKAVAEEGNLTKAGRRLFLTQSALSHQLKEIESRLGVLLFQRIQKRMQITPAGERVLLSAERVLSEMDAVENDVRALVNGENGRVRVSTACYTCYHWLPSFMTIFQKKFPGVDIQIVAEATPDPVPKLMDGQLDVAIVSDPDLTDSRLSFYPLFSDEVVAVVSSRQFKNKSFLKAGDFTDQTVIVHRQPTEDSTLFQNVLNPASVVPKKIVEILLTEAIVEMVRAGLGVATMARWAVRPYLKNGGLKLLPLLSKRGVTRTWYAVTLKSAREPKYMKYFLSCLERYPRL